MIVKSITHKHWQGLFRRMVEYVDYDKGRSKADNTFCLYHNTLADGAEEIIAEFQDNDRFRRQRKNGVALRHDILSFSPKDSESLDLDKLYDLASKYLELRQEKGMAFAKLHNDDDHKHIHFLISANERHSSKSNWKTKAEFEQIKVDLERYQLEKYPELTNSLVKLKTPETELRRAELQQIVLESFGRAEKSADFLRNLKQVGLTPYYYRDKPRGVLDEKGKKHRFGKFGVD